MTHTVQHPFLHKRPSAECLTLSFLVHRHKRPTTTPNSDFCSCNIRGIPPKQPQEPIRCYHNFYNAKRPRPPHNTGRKPRAIRCKSRVSFATRIKHFTGLQQTELYAPRLVLHATETTASNTYLCYRYVGLPQEIAVRIR